MNIFLKSISRKICNFEWIFFVGYIEGADLPESRQNLVKTGDFMGTFMGWLKDVEAGGGTAYVYPNFEGTIMPERVSLIYFCSIYSLSIC